MYSSKLSVEIVDNRIINSYMDVPSNNKTIYIELNEKRFDFKNNLSSQKIIDDLKIITTISPTLKH